MAYLTLAVTIGVVGILNAVLFWFMPRLTRHDLYFAVTTPPGFRDGPEAKAILRRFRIELVLFIVLAFILVGAGVAWLGVKFIAGGPIIQLVMSFIAFYRARQRVLPHSVSPTMIREADLHSRHRGIPGGWAAATGPFVLLIVGTVFLWIHGRESAVRVIDHSLTGLPYFAGDAHNLAGVYFLSTAGILASLTLILYGTWHWLRPVYASGPEAANELKFRRTASILLLVIEYGVTVHGFWITLASAHHDLPATILLPFFLGVVLVAVVVLARLGQGGSRLTKTENPLSAVAPVGDRTPDKYWKLGVFYFNRDDSAVVVERRFGLGYTLNLARPASWIIMLLIFLAPLAAILAHVSKG